MNTREDIEILIGSLPPALTVDELSAPDRARLFDGYIRSELFDCGSDMWPDGGQAIAEAWRAGKIADALVADVLYMGAIKKSNEDGQHVDPKLHDTTIRSRLSNLMQCRALLAMDIYEDCRANVTPRINEMLAYHYHQVAEKLRSA